MLYLQLTLLVSQQTDELWEHVAKLFRLNSQNGNVRYVEYDLWSLYKCKDILWQLTVEIYYIEVAWVPFILLPYIQLSSCNKLMRHTAMQITTSTFTILRNQPEILLPNLQQITHNLCD